MACGYWPENPMKRSRLRSDPEKVRDWQRRSRAKNRLKRGRLNPVNRERQKRRKEQGKVYGPKHDWHATQRCWAEIQGFGGECMGDVVGHHEPSVGAGGTDEREITLCWNHHTGQYGIHNTPPSEWEAKYGSREEAVAHYERKWQEERDG